MSPDIGSWFPGTAGCCRLLRFLKRCIVANDNFNKTEQYTHVQKYKNQMCIRSSWINIDLLLFEFMQGAHFSVISF